MAGLGGVGPGTARHCKSRQGYRFKSFYPNVTMRGVAWRGVERLGVDRQGKAVSSSLCIF